MGPAAKAVFLDRDGVINRRPTEGAYITSPDDFVLMPGVGVAISRLNHNGYLVFVVTNQSCIGRGIVPAEVVSKIHERMREAIRDCEGHIEEIYVCPHDSTHSCDCRKPKPGMLFQAAKEHSLDLAQCWMVGDSASDVVAGREAGCRTAFLGPEQNPETDVSSGSLCDAVDRILAEPSLGMF